MTRRPKLEIVPKCVLHVAWLAGLWLPHSLTSCLWTEFAAATEVLYGYVVSISDGDTLTVLTSEKRQVKVRLAEIDTPERRQPYGTVARQALAAKVFRKQVTVVVDTVDRYGRKVGHVYSGSRHINKEMVAEGHAWVYRRYLKDKSLIAVEDEARVEGFGLWGLSEARHIPPWEWRRQQRGGNEDGTAAAARAVDKSCSSKHYCREMANCDEARFYLRQCGLDRLDGDGDGIPCEAICK